MPAMGAGIILPAFILIAIISFSILVLPITPTLTAAFKIDSRASPTFEVTEKAYNKVSLFASTSMTKGDITLSYLAGTVGTYSLFVAISYGGDTLSTVLFESLGDGLYQISVAYLPRLGEQPSIPYLVSFTLLAQNGQKIMDVVVTVYPT
jgi:hypothetical protein